MGHGRTLTLDVGPGCDLVDDELQRIEYGVPS